jgi:excisionase family DNA binding protein
MDGKYDHLLEEKEAAKYLGVSKRTLQGFRRRRQGPAYHRIGGCIRYRVSDLEGYLAIQRIEPEIRSFRRGRQDVSVNA